MLNKSILFLFLGILLFPSFAAAEDDEDFVRIVLLGKSDLEIVEKELQKFDEGMDIRGQGWFLKKVKSRGIRPKKLFKRRKDLTFILEVTETDFVFTIKQTKSEYIVRIYDQTGEMIKEVDAKGDRNGIDETGAAAVVSAFSTLVEEPEEEEEEEEAEDVPIEEKKKPENEEPVSDGSSNLSMSIAAGVLKRDFEVDSPGGALLTYNSTYYPGAQLDLTYLIGKKTNRPGVFLRAIGGLDSVAFEVDGERQVSSLLQIDAELGGFFSMRGDFGKYSLEVRFLGGLRHTRFQIDDSALPTTSYSTLNLGADFLFGNVYPDLSVRASLSFTPFGLFHDSASLFGESSFIYGFGAGLNALYGLSESLYLVGNFQMRNLRISFSGKGDSDFSDSNAFELTQTINIGIGLKF